MTNGYYDNTTTSSLDYFTANSLMTDITSDMIFSLDDSEEKIKLYLIANNFDLAIFKTTDAYGYKLFDSEHQTLSDLKSITIENRIDSETGLSEIVKKMRDHYYLFVFDSYERLIGLINYSDLNREPVQVFCFLVVSRFERFLRKVCMGHYSGDTWLSDISDEARHRIVDIFIDEKAKGIERSLIECTTITDLTKLLKKLSLKLTENNGKWYRNLGFDTPDEFKSTMNRLIDWRNAVGHNKDIFSNKNAGKELNEFISEVNRLTEVIDRWMNKHIENSPRIVTN